ncbi:MAG: MATE family efflux transporter [Ruminiclostridium sp.]|nr:MATE family efflux transporter [Ruminiclostridium sp.]MBQ9932982.1 MATE family efflux transporter [Ruminiclostridium sp.]
MELRFSNQDLRKLIVPLVIEQFLQFSAGLITSIMVAGLGEAAVSAVSLVDSVVILFLSLFSALATGGAVVAGQLIGLDDLEKGCKAAWQMLLFVGVSSVAVMALCYLGQNFILDTVFGDITPEVRQNAKTFLLITNASIPIIALYNGGAAIFRVMGNSKISMKMSLLMNVINIAGIAILIYGVGMGIEGAGIALFTGRTVAAVVILKLLCNQDLPIHIRRPLSFRFDGKLLIRILRIGVPNGMENGMFQLGKLLVLSLVSSFGTAAIAANAVGNAVAMFGVTPGMAMNLAMVTVISQCVGAGAFDQVRYYTKKLIKLTYAMMAVSNVIIILILPLLLKIYDLSPEATELARQILIYHSICAIVIWTPSFTMPYVLRAGNDVAPTMIIATVSMWLFRVIASYILGRYVGLGVFGVWIAMTIDWLVRAVAFVVRYKQEKWVEKSGGTLKKA